MNHYDVLGLLPVASTTDVRRAYLALARRHHPDAGGSVEHMRRINEAYTVLGDPRKRYAYDLASGHVEIGYEPPDLTDSDDPADIIDMLDVLDDRPGRAMGRRHGVVVVLPVGVFLASVVIGCVGLVIDVPAVIVVAFMVFLLSAALMALMPLFVMGRGRGTEQH